jgi:hypothetical protein
VRWLSGRSLRLHATLLIVGGGCLYAGWFELHRALSGNELSWVYTFEWPLFAAFAGVIWWRALHEDNDAKPASHHAGAAATTAETAEVAEATEAAGSADTRLAETGTTTAPADGGGEQLRAWQDYVARLNAEHPPGGPPPRKARR